MLPSVLAYFLASLFVFALVLVLFPPLTRADEKKWFKSFYAEKLPYRWFSFNLPLYLFFYVSTFGLLFWEAGVWGWLMGSVVFAIFLFILTPIFTEGLYVKVTRKPRKKPTSFKPSIPLLAFFLISLAIALHANPIVGLLHAFSIALFYLDDKLPKFPSLFYLSAKAFEYFWMLIGIGFIGAIVWALRDSIISTLLSPLSIAVFFALFLPKRTRERLAMLFKRGKLERETVEPLKEPPSLTSTAVPLFKSHLLTFADLIFLKAKGIVEVKVVKKHGKALRVEERKKLSFSEKQLRQFPGRIKPGNEVVVRLSLSDEQIADGEVEKLLSVVESWAKERSYVSVSPLFKEDLLVGAEVVFNPSRYRSYKRPFESLMKAVKAFNPSIEIVERRRAFLDSLAFYLLSLIEKKQSDDGLIDAVEFANIEENYLSFVRKEAERKRYISKHRTDSWAFTLFILGIALLLAGILFHDSLPPFLINAFFQLSGPLLIWGILLFFPPFCYTDEGLKLHNFLLGYREWLKKTRIKELPFSAVALWDEHFAYAFAFGIAKKAIKELSLPDIGGDIYWEVAYKELEKAASRTI